MRDLPTNQLTLDQVLALPEPELAEIVATRYFRWERTGAGYAHKPKDPRGVAYSWRPFNPCQSADDDRLALSLVRKRHPHLLQSMGRAMLDLARASAPEIDACCVSVYASRGDYCRALLLANSSAWTPTSVGRAFQPASSGGREQPSTGALPAPSPSHAKLPAVRKETTHEQRLDGDADRSILRTTAGLAPAAPAVSTRAGTGAATPAPQPAVHSHSR